MTTKREPDKELTDQGFEMIRVAKPKEEHHLPEVNMCAGDLKVINENQKPEEEDEPESSGEDTAKGFAVIRKMPT